MEIKRFKNYGLWVAIFAFIPMLLEAFGLKVLPQNYSEIVKAFLSILIIAGILNNPVDGNGFMDSKK